MFKSPSDGPFTFLPDDGDDRAAGLDDADSGPTILRDERRCHAAEIAAEIEARIALRRRTDDVVVRLSRALGPILFAFCLGSVGLAVVTAVA